MYFKENKGVTLLALTITIIVMLIITSTIIYNTNIHVRTEKINKLYNDIENISNKIEDYYLKYGEIPTIGNVYCDKTVLNDLLSNNANAQNATLKTISDVTVNPNDGDEYYIIDLEKLEGLTLNYGYGDDYTKVKELKDTPEDITTELDEIYIINKATHQIYYPSGVFADDFMYYSYSLDTKEAINEYNVSSTDGIIKFNNENVVDVNSLKVYGNSIQNGDPTPDNPVEIQSVGEYDETTDMYKIPITVSGKNIFGYKDAEISNGVIIEELENGAIVQGNEGNSPGSAFNSNGWFRPGASSRYSNIVPKLNPNETVTISADITVLESYTNLSEQTFGIYLYSREAIDYATKTYKLEKLNETYRISATYTNTNATDIITVYPVFTINSNIMKIENIQIEKGDTATDYEPYVEPVTTNIYLNEPLRKVGEDYADYIDFKNQQVIRNVKEKIFDGTEKWYYESLSYGNNFYTYISDSKEDSTIIKVLSNMFKWYDRGSLTSNYACRISTSSKNANFRYQDYSNLTDFQAKLVELFNDGNPLNLYYVLATPTKETKELPTIPMHKGTNIITIDTGIPPSNIELNYYEINK